MEVIRQLIECDLDPPFLIHAIAFGLNPGYASFEPLARAGPQDDLGRLANLDFASFAFVDIGEHPHLLRIDECEHRLSRGKSCAEFLLPRNHHGVIG